MFRIKICGITIRDDARQAIDAGCDAVGLNFYPQSPRHISAEQAREICFAAGNTADRVGVFVNAAADDINSLVARLALSHVQLHGDEPPEFLTQLTDAVKVIRVYRFGEGSPGRIAADLDACCRAGRMPDAVLLDAAATGQYGGTGQTVSWQNLQGERPWLRGRPLILAGGLTAENVAEAIRVVAPDAVDVASGVETTAGVKDAEMVRQFVGNAKGAFDQPKTP